MRRRLLQANFRFRLYRGGFTTRGEREFSRLLKKHIEYEYAK